MSQINRLDTEAVARAKAEFFQDGKTVADWARQHNFVPSQVYAVLSGKNKARFGRGHEIAVALGLKQEKSRAAAVTTSPVAAPQHERKI